MPCRTSRFFPSLESKHTFRDVPNTVFLISGDGRIISLPIPARTRRDPLSWSRGKRLRAFLALLYFCIIGLTIVQAPSIMFVELAHTFQKEAGTVDVSMLLTLPTLFMGVGALLWIPVSAAIGRRPVFLLCTIILLFSTVLAASAGSYEVMAVAVSLQGLAEGLGTSLAMLMIIDLTFIHQRPQALAFLWAVAGSIALVCVALSRLTMGTFWRRWYWIWTAPALGGVLLAFFYYPETYFIRPAVAFDGRIVIQSETEKVQIYENWDDLLEEKVLPDQPKTRLGTWFSELSIYTAQGGGWKAMAGCYVEAVTCLFHPIIFWVCLLNALSFAGMMSIGSTYFAILKKMKAPAYSVEVFNGAASLGALSAYPLCGLLTTKIVRSLARRNRGVRVPEHYVPVFIIPVLSNMISVILFGLAAEKNWPWYWLPIAYCSNALGFSGGSAASALFIAEAYPGQAASAIMAVFGGAYCASFGTSYVLPLWLKSQGVWLENLEIGIAIGVTGLGLCAALWARTLKKVLSSD